MHHQQIVELLRAIQSRPGGTGAILNLLRGSEVRGAVEMNALTDLVPDLALKQAFARLGCEDARHAYALLVRMQEVGFAPFRLPPELDRMEGLLTRCRAREVTRLYADRGVVGDAELMELIVAVLIPKRDAVRTLRVTHEALDRDPETRGAIGAILEDEARHVAYLEGCLERFERRFSRRAVTAARQRLEEVFSQLTVAYRAGLQTYLERTV